MKKYLSKKEVMAYGFAAAGSYLVAGIAQSYLMIFLTDILIVSAGYVTVLMVVARIWDAVNDPIMGIIVDKTNTKHGKMRPYVKIGAFIMAISTACLFIPMSGISDVGKMIYAAVAYLIFGMAYTFVDVPAMGLMSVSTPNSDERANLLSFYVTVGTIGGLLPVGLLPVFQMFLPDKWLYFAMSIFTATIVLASYLTLYKNSKERFSTVTEKIKVSDMVKVAKQNTPMLQAFLMSMIASPRYLMMPALIYIATYVISFGTLSSGTVLIILYIVIGAGMFAGILLTPVAYRKFGYKITAIASAIFGGVGLILAYVVSGYNIYIALPFLTIGGLGLGAYNVLPYPMVGDSLDFLEYKSGERMEGVCFSLNSFVTKFNNAVGFIGLAACLVIFNFVEPVESGVALAQSEFTVNGLFALVSIIPGVSFLLSIIPMAFYSFNGKKKEAILAELETRRANNDMPNVLVVEEE